VQDLLCLWRNVNLNVNFVRQSSKKKNKVNVNSFNWNGFRLVCFSQLLRGVMKAVLHYPSKSLKIFSISVCVLVALISCIDLWTDSRRVRKTECAGRADEVRQSPRRPAPIASLSEFNNLQWGFRKGRSTELLLLHMEICTKSKEVYRSYLSRFPKSFWLCFPPTPTS